MKWFSATNSGGSIPLAEIPVVDYARFYNGVCGILSRVECHVAEYFAVPDKDGLRFFILVADDSSGKVLISSYVLPGGDGNYPPLNSIASLHPRIHPFEREIAELHGVVFEGSPWPKPLRYPSGRPDTGAEIDNYPFYKIDGESLHQVNVGPIHAGIIEPGAFRFICNGEQVLHLEIALGYQHRGVEALMAASRNMMRSVCLAESIAGDSAVAHSTAFAMTAERLAGIEIPHSLELQRALGLELERIAMHIADTGAMCMDIGYQLGQVACEALRTIVINTTQKICGNRFGKGLIRPAGSWCNIDERLAGEILCNVDEVARRYAQVKEDLKSSPSVLARFEECGIVTTAQARETGLVGMAARASGLKRDVRQTHPWGVYAYGITHECIWRDQGDVMARLMVRGREVAQSVSYIREMLRMGVETLADSINPVYDMQNKHTALSFALVEGWRGEICHIAVTDSKGELAAYKVKDPSMHNWLGLALAVRGAGISDFPICNKSFNLSYCGHDL